MTRHHKAPSAGSIRRPVSDRALLASLRAPGASGATTGSGARAIGPRAALLALALAALALFAFVPLAGAKVVTDGFGTPGTFGGQFGGSGARGIAINQTGAGGVPAGTVYVADVQERIERFSPSGVFERAWGEDVVGRNEQQDLSFNNTNGGSFTLELEGQKTGPIAIEPYNGSQSLRKPSAAEIQSALSNLGNVGAGNVKVSGNLGKITTGSTFTIEFEGTLSGTNVAQLVADGSALTGPDPTEPPSIETSTIEDGSGGNFTGSEICLVAAECKAGIAAATTGNGGQVARPNGLAIDQATGDLYVTEQGNRRISEFDANGNFIRAWGWDVIASGKPNDNGAGFEVCDTTAGNSPSDCKQGSSGYGAGQFYTGNGFGVPAIDPSGDVWVTQAHNGPVRLQEFSSSGQWLRIVGTDVITDGAEGVGTLASGNKKVSGVAMKKKYFEVGQTVTGTGIEAGTTITAVGTFLTPATSTLTLSKAATASGSQTITAPEGAGNKPTNEEQTVTLKESPSGGAFALEFEGQVTGAVGKGTSVANKNEITGVSTTAGTFKVGQIITAKQFNNDKLPEGTRITAVNGSTITVSAEFSVANPVELVAYGLPYNASATEVENALNDLSTIGGAGGAVSVSGSAGGPYTVEFGGTRFAGADVPEMSAQAGGLTPYPSPNGRISISSANPGALESCTVASECRQSSAPGTAPGQFAEGFLDPEQATFDSAGNLYLTDKHNNRVEKFNAAMSSAENFAPASFAPYTTEAPERIAAVDGGERLLFAVNNHVNASEMQLIETDLNGAVTDTSLVGAGYPAGQTVSALAENETTGTVYLASAYGSFYDLPRQVFMLNSTPAPDPVQELTAIDATDTTATFHAAVDPTGGLVSCQFEYSTDQSEWTVVEEPECANLSEGGGKQPLAAEVEELVPNTTYYVRLAVSRVFVGNSTKYTPVESFTTEAPAPVITRFNAIQITDSSVRIAGLIDPRHSETSWVVKYGTTPGLGSETEPIAIGDGGSSSTPIVVSQVIHGLQAGTTYYYEVVATSPSGPTPSAKQSFTTRSEALPMPDNRAYEMVSPVDKNSNNIDAVNHGFGLQSTIAENGEGISFCTGTIFGNPPPPYNGACSFYASERGPSGWSTQGIIPAFCPRDFASTARTSIGAGITEAFSRNVDYSVFERSEGAEPCPLPQLDPAAPNLPGMNLYRSNLLAPPTKYDLLAPAPHFDEAGTYLGEPDSYSTSGIKEVAGGSDDFSHVVYTSNGQQSGEDPAPGNFQKVYDWHEGTVSLVSKAPDGTPFTTDSAPVHLAYAYHGISASGDRILFANPVPDQQGLTIGVENEPYSCVSEDCQIYMREDDSSTYEVSQSECTAGGCPAPNSYAAYFQYATSNTSKVWFTSNAKLTDDDTSASGQDLYMYTQSADPATEKNLTLLSQDNEPADGTEANVRAVLGASNDGDVVYFVARGQLVAGGPTELGFKIYRWSWNNGSPELTFIVNLPLEEYEQSLNWFRMQPNYHTLHVAGGNTGWEGGSTQTPENHIVSDNGKYLLLQSRAQLVPAADFDNTVDLYRWSQEEGMVCISCQEPGVASNGDSFVDPPLQGAPNGYGGETQQYTMSSNGEEVFFQTPDALLPQDENGNVEDVYEWKDGTLSLISDGRGSSLSYLLGTSANANDVFFVTAEKLVGWDIDPNNDIYDARVGGGFPEPSPQGAPCEGEACRARGSSPPAATPAGTAVFEGPGNPAPLTCRKHFRKAFVKGKAVCKRVRPHHKKKHRGKGHHGKRHHGKKNHRHKQKRRHNHRGKRHHEGHHLRAANQGRRAGR